MIFLAAALSLLSQPAEFSPDQVSEDLAVAREALERLHPGYERYAERAVLDAAWGDVERAGRDGADLAELYLGLSGILTDIRCDHTKAELPEAVGAARETAPVYLPFRFVLFNGRMFVDEATQASGLGRGEEVLSIDGDPVAERLEAARRYMPVDGYTDHVRDVALQSIGDFLGSGFDHFDPIINPPADTVRLGVRGPAGTRHVDVPRIGFADYRALKDQARWQNFSDEGSVTVERPAPGVAVLNVETFVNYRTPVDAGAVFSRTFERLNAEGVETLIVDMRRNGGGSTDAMIGLLSHVTQAEQTQINSEVWVTSYDFDGLRDYINTWDRNLLNPPARAFRERPDGNFDVLVGVSELMRPFARAENAFNGDVVILTSRANASGATQLIGALNGQEHITLIGEETGGSQEGPTAGQIWFVTLPNSGIVVRVPYLFQRSNVEDPEFGVGYSPDIEAPETYASWLAGRDPALEIALDFATSQ